MALHQTEHRFDSIVSSDEEPVFVHVSTTKLFRRTVKREKQAGRRLRGLHSPLYQPRQHRYISLSTLQLQGVLDFRGSINLRPSTGRRSQREILGQLYQRHARN
ncbi:emb2 [Haliotid herpesvirus 1]|nr:emb2 [Haliotid herpesvirus 1]